MKMLFLVLLSVTSSLAVGQRQCPPEYARFSTTHSMCLPPNRTCTIISMGVGQENRREILRTHNELRSKVAMGREEQAGGLPSASNMMEMEWDFELEEIAQGWANQCRFEHDCDECRAVENFEVGQNIALRVKVPVLYSRDPDYVSDSITPVWKEMVEGIYNEVKSFNKEHVENFQFSEETGQFTQMIWAETWRVGCGFVAYKEKNLIYQYYVCNYGPRGNRIGAPIYNPGIPCTGCPTNTCCGNCTAQHPNYAGLCRKIKTLIE